MKIYVSQRGKIRCSYKNEKMIANTEVKKSQPDNNGKISLTC